MKKDYKKIIQIVLFPAIMLAFNQLVNMPFDLYKTFPLLDVPMHLLGGMSISVSSVLLLICLRERSLVGRKNWRPSFFLVIGLVGCAAILWEFYEFLSDYFFQTTFQPGGADMVSDLFLGLVGGCVAWWYMTRQLGYDRE